ncbi:MAG: hypothetical protein COY39_04960 [Alphaproteobacteria bacterium CG_4_10_14_0_8_um_filter_37_21]|nr:MAG: hypothetical protein COY39_04960 [Alphaproteobacteria bacterium CG_4_10_14_0_8_um_filter_37_21]
MIETAQHIEYFKRHQNEDTLAPCWLLTGDITVPKAAFAKKLAKAMLYSSELQQHGMPNSLIDKQIEMGCYPNYLYVERPLQEDGTRSREINVETAKSIKKFLEKKSAVLGWRVIIVDAIDDMNRFGANALLKILEAPPAKILMLLLCHQPGTILPTIRSRCHVLALKGDAEIFDNHILDEKFEAVLSQVLQGDNSGVEALSRDIVMQDKSLKPFFVCVLNQLHKWILSEKKPKFVMVQPLEFWVNAYKSVNTFFNAFKDAHIDPKQTVLATFILIKDPNAGDFSNLM